MPEKVGQNEPPKTPKEKKMKRIKNPAYINLFSQYDKKYQARAYAQRNNIPEYIDIEDISEPPPPTIQEQQEQSYENILTTLANYQDADNRRFSELQAEAKKRDDERTLAYGTIMTDFSTKLSDAETKRATQYTSFMSQLTQSYTDAENVRKAEKKTLDDQIKAERDLQLKTELEKKTLLENTTAQQLQKLRLKGTGVRKPTIKTSNVGLSMTGLIGRRQAIGL